MLLSASDKMTRGKKTPARRRRSVKKKPPGWLIVNFRRIVLFFLLFSLLVFSLVTVSYVIFFRTVLAQETATISEGIIVYEEPFPPAHVDPFDLPTSEIRKIFGDENLQQGQLPKVAIIIDDMGYDDQLGKRLVDLDIELTYSFLPFAPHSKILEEYAHHQNKMILLHLPLEPKSEHWDPGPGTLYLEDSSEDQIAKFEDCLQQVQYAVGVNNHMGSQFSEDEQAMWTVLEQVKNRSLIFIDSYTTAESVGLRVAREQGIKSSRRHVFLDNILDLDAVCNELERLVVLAEKQGYAIGIGHPHEVTLNGIVKCSPQYKDRVEYVDISQVVQ